jgi:uncharacterized coiled-coil DUF342 family protein
MNSIETVNVLAGAMSEQTDAKASEVVAENEDLQEKLQSMEKKISKLREIRSQHNDSANRFAEQRNAVQGQYKEHKEKLDARLEVVKAIRVRIKEHKELRNSIQSQMKELFGQHKSNKDSAHKGRSVGAEYNKLTAEVKSIEHRLETSGTITLAKENGLVKAVKLMRRRISELEPDLKQQALVRIDLDDIEGTIARMKSEADSAHKLMLEAVSEADKEGKELDEMFAHRDFLKGEGDRHHNAFVAEKEKANEIHEKAVELIKQVTEVKDALKAERKERQSWIDDHNASVGAEMQSGAESEDVANDLISTLLGEGSLSLGGTMDSDASPQQSRPRPKKKGKKISATRKR